MPSARCGSRSAEDEGVAGRAQPGDQFVARVVERFDLPSLGWNTPESVHVMVEAKKLAYADIEHYVGDPASMKMPVDHFLSDSYVASRRALINPGKAMERAEPGPAPRST